MMTGKNHFKSLSTLSFLLILTSVSQAGLKEDWYMYRGRENMKIKNYNAAIEAFEKAVQINADNREAAHELGIAYENQGVVDKAVNQYDNYLSRWPDDHEIALRQARFLKWSRYSYRQKDAIKYYKLALSHDNDPKIQLEYADFLASRKETSTQAITEYESLLRKNPKNGAAHKGLAKAYAWNGNQDQALYHAQLAREYGDQTQDTKALESSLAKDRRPEIGTEVLVLRQTSSQEFDLSGVRAGAFGSFHLTPFLTGRLRGGAEMFWNQVDSKSAGYFGMGVEYRLGPEKSLLLEGTQHGLSSDGLEGRASFEITSENHRWQFGLKRELIYDSYLSLVGSKKGTAQEIGAARKTIVFAQWSKKLETTALKLTPYTGWVSAASVSPNAVSGLDFDLTMSLGKEGWALVGMTQIASYQKDHSGFQNQNTSPYPGGYFSPSQYLSQDLLVRYEVAESEDSKWFVNLGPSYQFVGGTTSNGSKFGARGGASLLRKLDTRLYLQLQAEVRKIADVYTKAEGMAWLTYRF